MAIGDIARTTGFPRQVGNMWMLVGTIEADSTATAFALTSTANTLVSCHLHNESDNDTTVLVVLNSDDGTAGTAQGSIWVQSSGTDDDTWRFCAFYV